MSDTVAINGLILAGGKSSRMGYDKSLIDYHGKPQREYLHDLLGKFCRKVFVSCRKDQAVPPHLNPLHDQFNIESPLNGILTALTTDHSLPWLVVAADMPMIDVKVIEYLLKQRDPSRMATCFMDSDNTNPEPLLSIWEPQAFISLEAYYKKGKISPRDFLKQSDVKLLAPLSDKMHLNINSEEELRSFRNDQLS
jgi:molybdenum cofactor guanylyltransferase